jgi:DNA mismatch endonuclease (patch repair protein)
MPRKREASRVRNVRRSGQRVSKLSPRLLTTPKRSQLMARVRQKGTSPELVVRGILERHGYEFSTNGAWLPGSPDLVDEKRKRAVFVHGCFWHRHAACKASTMPKRNAQFWTNKFEQNMERDRRKTRQLRHLGYRVLIVWECQVKSRDKLVRLERRLDRFFREPTNRT